MKPKTLKNPEFSKKRQCYVSKIADSGKRPTDSQIRQAYLSSIEDGRYLESVQQKWDAAAENGRFDVAVFDSEDDSNAEVIEGSLPWDKASKLAQKLFDSGKYYGVEIIDCDEDNMEPIVWIETKK